MFNGIDEYSVCKAFVQFTNTNSLKNLRLRQGPFCTSCRELSTSGPRRSGHPHNDNERTQHRYSKWQRILAVRGSPKQSNYLLRGLSCVTQQTCRLCRTADTSAASHSRSCLLCHTADTVCCATEKTMSAVSGGRH